MMRIATLGLWSALFLMVPQAMSADNWPGWRGPQRNGHASDERLPIKWSDANVVWSTDLEGVGQSSPVVWGKKVFLTAALNQGRQRVVMALNRGDGQLIWKRTVWEGNPEPSHNMNGWASATCETDGEVVVAFFGKGGLHGFHPDGELLWSRDLGVFESPWGTAACPLIVDNLVIQNCDADTKAYLIAVDKLTGETVWRVERPNFRGWSSPVLIEHEGHREVVLNGHTGVMAYDPATGKTLWQVDCPKGRGTPTVTPHEGLVYVVNGLGGGGAYAIRPGGNGNVTDTHRIWFKERRTRDLPSPIIVGNTMLVMSLRGSILSAYDIRSGEELWKARIGGQISSSPIAYGGYAFFITEAGETVVIDPTAENPVVARNRIETSPEPMFRASITPHDGQLLIRSNTRLYCIAK